MVTGRFCVMNAKQRKRAERYAKKIEKQLEFLRLATPTEIEFSSSVGFIPIDSKEVARLTDKREAAFLRARRHNRKGARHKSRMRRGKGW